MQNLKQAELLEDRHLIPDGGRREGHAIPVDQRPRRDRTACLHVIEDHHAQDVALALREDGLT
jgi:hypothetical protein